VVNIIIEEYKRKINPDIIDNRSVCFKDEIKKYLQQAIKANFATGYFYLSGFNLLKEDLEHLEKINILMGNETNQSTCDDIVAGYSAQLISDSKQLDDEKPQFKSLLALRDFIKEKKVDVKVYVPEKRGNFHTKLYIIYRTEASRPQSIAILGSSNFTQPGIMGNTELNYVHTQQVVVDAFDEWFNDRFKEAKDFNADLIKIIESSAAYKRYEAKQKDLDFITPFELYKLIIFEFLNGDISIYESALAEFQKLGVENAKEKIRKFNGAIISDSVGLGKSFIGGELIKWYREQNKRVLLIVPASIVDQWRDLLEKDGLSDETPYFGLSIDGIGIKIISESKFSNHSEDEVRKEYGDFDVVLIDEAHRFRNSEPERYKNIQKLKEKTFILLTATPLNNTVRDLKNIISIFTNQVILRNEHLDFNAFDEFYKISKKVRDKSASPEEIAKMNLSIHEISRILEEVMILRTRKIIIEKYPDLEINGQKIEFSTPKIYPIEYNLSSSYEPIYQNIDTFIANLKLPHLYVINQSSGKTLEGLFKVLLLKRLESSIYSFLKSLNHIIESETTLMEDIVNFGFDDAIKKRLKDFEKVEQQVQADVDLLSFIDDNVETKKSEELDEQQVIDSIKFDIDSIDTFKKSFLSRVKRGDGEYDFDDDKMDRLISELFRRKKDKILIFTQFRATAEYLFHHLKNSDRNVDYVVGGETSPSGRKVKYKENGVIKERTLSGRDLKVRLFSPKSYKFKLEGTEKEIDILISTDTLSEGVNLQDCSIIINYDLPWNPTRIIQRVGRVDRIGNVNKITVFNFFPDKDIESLLKLLEKLQNKIKDIATIVGKENGILSGDEETSIKTIGEKITEIRKFNDIMSLEEEAKNPIFKITGEDKEAIVRFKLRNQINELGLKKTDFREYLNTPYSVAEIGKKGIFSLYRIFDKKDEHKYKDVLLYYDIDANSFSEINPLDITINSQTQGHYKSSVNDKINFDNAISRLDSHFEEMFYELKSGYKDVEMIPQFKTYKVQEMVIEYLNKILKHRTLEEDIQRQKSALYELKNLYNNIFLTQNDAVELKKKFVKGVMSTDRDEFIKIIKDFRKEVISQNPDYQKYLRSEKNIEYKQVCWGAFV